MSCCGEARHSHPDETNAQTKHASSTPVTTQPPPTSPPQFQPQTAVQPEQYGQPPGSQAWASAQSGSSPVHGNTNAPSPPPTLAQPTPVYPAPDRTTSTSPSMMSMSTLPASQGVPTPPSMGVSSLARPPSAYQPNGFYPSAHGRGISVSDGGNRSVSMSFSSVDGSGAGANQGRMSVAVDFGTTFSGVAFASARISAGQVQQILHWPGSSETFRKIPTCLVYDENGKIIAWGLEAKNTPVHACFIKCEWFKLFLEPHALRNEDAVDSRLPQLPPGKTAIDVIIDFLSCIWEYAKGQITRQLGSVADLDSADIILTVPAAWDAKGCELMRDAAISAGLVQSSRAGDKNWRDRLRIITEPEAAAVHCATMTDVHRLKTSQNFMICDAGGGTVDLAVYKILGQLANLEIAEICARSGANCGSLFLDLRFRSLVETLLADYPAHLDPPSMANFMRAFSENEKLEYRGVDDDGNMIQFSCFNVQPDDPSVGLINGELVIPGKLLREHVFDPVINQVLDLVEEQLKKAEQRIDALLLVGGFSGSEYLFKRVNEQFGGRIRVIARPVDADTATLRGAAKHGLGGRNVVSSTIVPRSYIMKVKLPAESEDWLKRPAYIKSVDGGTPVCENRLQYLVTKGAILRRGQRVITKFCKYSQSSQDRIFVATLYTSDSDKVMRYNDEGETDELCKWTVDLGALPVFQQNAAASMGNGFYTEFELGLEFDSAEVRGVLLYDGQEWGKIVFDFLS